MNKICCKCRESKPINDFGRSNESKDGFKYSCKSCRNEQNKLYRNTHKIRCDIPIKGTIKKCNICKCKKPSEEFGRNRCSKDGRESRCRKCMREYGRKVYNKNKKLPLIVTKDSKICSKCNIEKPINEFHKRLCRNNGTPMCKKCYREYRMNKWRNNEEYREKAKLRSAKYNEAHKEQKSQYNKTYSETNKEKRNKRLLNRKINDINFRMRGILAGRVISAIKQGGGIKSIKTMELIGCSISELKIHLESKFLKDMTWDNYGRNGWHIDHIIPCATFDLTKPEEQKKCFHYTNLQPLWGEDNIKKSSWYNGKLVRKTNKT